MSKKRLLLLHGHRQTGQLLIGRMERFRKKLAKEYEIELVAIDAPFDGESLKTWWTRDGNDYQGLDTTLDLVKSTWDSDGSFVGLMGFSQGARLTHLLATLHHGRKSAAGGQHQEPFLPGLKFVIMVSGYDAPLPDSLREKLSPGYSLIAIPSLHVWGTTDKLVFPEQSQAVVAAYRNPEIHVHDGGHHVPMRAESVRTYLSFIAQQNTCTCYLEPQPPQQETIDPDMLQQQNDEIEALEAIYPDEMKIISTNPPLSFEIALPASEEGIWPPHQVSVFVRFPLRYPDVAPELKLVHQNDGKPFSSTNHERCVKAMSDAANEEEGMPCIFSCLQAARDFFESGKMEVLTSETDIIEPATNAFAESASESSLNGEADTAVGGVPLVSEQRKGDCILQGLEIAQSILTAQLPVQSRGGTWSLTIGLVGKPSAGKSTFFNTATGFARQRQQESEIGGAAMAPHPFTTIDPNVGFCLVPAPDGSCPTGDETMGCTHGRDHLGRRFLPVQLKDVAGLVPGAYQGRGRGNQFLNDLTDADVILHVLDASGTADAEGNKTDAGVHPIDDMEWIRKELIEWVYTNLMRKWDSVVRRGRR
jgi:ribosome-binding ATPase